MSHKQIFSSFLILGLVFLFASCSSSKDNYILLGQAEKIVDYEIPKDESVLGKIIILIDTKSQEIIYFDVRNKKVRERIPINQ